MDKFPAHIIHYNSRVNYGKRGLYYLAVFSTFLENKRCEVSPINSNGDANSGCAQNGAFGECETALRMSLFGVALEAKICPKRQVLLGQCSYSPNSLSVLGLFTSTLFVFKPYPCSFTLHYTIYGVHHLYTRRQWAVYTEHLYSGNGEHKMLIIVLMLSILLQLGAAFITISLIRVTGSIWAWLIIAAAIFLMVIRRGLSLFNYLQAPGNSGLAMESELIALATSVLLLVGISLFSPLLKSVRAESEKLNEQLLNATPDTFAVLLDQSGNILTINNFAKEFLVGTTGLQGEVHELIGRIFCRDFDSLFREIQVSHSSISAENEVEGKWLVSNLEPLANRFGDIDKCALLVRDMTELKRGYEAQLQHEQIVMQADKLASIGMLATGITHELNNPNQFILSHIGMIEKLNRATIPILDKYRSEFGDFNLAGLPYDEARTALSELAAEIKAGSERIKRIVGELRSFSLGNKSIQFEPVSIKALLDSALILLRNMIQKNTRNFSVDIEENVPQIAGNFQQLEQVFINIISNACQALTTPDDSIHITIRSEEGYLLVEVDDTGIGIEDDKLELITDPFYTTKREQGGTGLGLAITKKIVEDHGGTMTFTSTPLAGTRVSLAFPVDSKLQEH